ncbi:putative jnk/sapk-associated protein [Operophtera brumata]|uniref:JNK-interacting protein 3 n=1 Tax=Operophtera brumata TaxID=104452 RepID=A0A0L7LPQ6_OPEBR|nr:putative jnk/sapk-associated protein [Operophtera brumata]
MGKEVENLILENNELLATKNALNVVKDDLIVKVDELTGEQEILREEVNNLSSAREKLRERERFMELQDAVRWTEMVRASRVDSTMDKKNKQSIWKFFSNLFSSSNERPQRPLSTPHLRAVAAPQPALRHSRTQADFIETQLTDHHHARRHERTLEISKATLVHSPEVEQINRQLQSTQSVEYTEKNLSSLVWICSSTQTKGIVMIIDANNPAEVIESFPVSDKHILCVASASLFCVGKSESAESQSNGLPGSLGSNVGDNGDKEVAIGTARLVTGGHLGSPEPGVDAFAQEQSNAESRSDVPQDRKMSTVMATVWLGTKSGNLYVHSAIGNYSKCLARVKLNDAILSIVACSSRCIVALADGTVAIFARSANGQWDFTQYWLMTLGDPKCSGHGSLVRAGSPTGAIPWCSMAHAQLSFHGHRDAVTFFVAAPGAAGSPDSPRRHDPQPPMLVLRSPKNVLPLKWNLAKIGFSHNYHIQIRIIYVYTQTVKTK